MAINPTNWGYTPNYVQDPITMEWIWTGRPETSWMGIPEYIDHVGDFDPSLPWHYGPEGEQNNPTPNPLYQKITSLPWIENVISTSGRVPAPTTGLDINNAMVVRGPDGRLYNAFQAGLNPFEFQVTHEGRLRSGSNQGDATYFDSPISGFTNIGGIDYILTDPKTGLPGYQTSAPLPDDSGGILRGLVDPFQEGSLAEFLLKAYGAYGGAQGLGNVFGEGLATMAGGVDAAGNYVAPDVSGGVSQIGSNISALPGQIVDKIASLPTTIANLPETLSNLPSDVLDKLRTLNTIAESNLAGDVAPFTYTVKDGTELGSQLARELVGYTATPVNDSEFLGRTSYDELFDPVATPVDFTPASPTTTYPQTDIQFDQPVVDPKTGQVLTPQEVITKYPELYPEGGKFTPTSPFNRLIQAVTKEYEKDPLKFLTGAGGALAGFLSRQKGITPRGLQSSAGLRSIGLGRTGLGQTGGIGTGAGISVGTGGPRLVQTGAVGTKGRGGVQYFERMAGGGAIAGGVHDTGLGYLKSAHDGMADKIDATIDNKRPAKLSGGEFVIPADVVSHLGNGNSEAGAKQLYDLMERVRKARTGTSTQGKQINPKKYLPK